jgi:hypothetical protein
VRNGCAGLNFFRRDEALGLEVGQGGMVIQKKDMQFCLNICL